MSVKNSVFAIPLTTFNINALGPVYQAVNAGLDQPCVILRMSNNSNTNVTISYDGVTDHEYIAAGASLNLNAQANSQPNNYMCQFRKGTIVYIKGAAGGVGTFALSGYYNPQGV